LVAYLIGWNTLVLKWLDYSEAGRAIEFPETGYKWNQLGQLALKFYADYADLDYPNLLSALDAAKIRIVDQVNIRSNAQLYGQLRYGKHTMRRMIQLNTAAPYKNATARMRRSRKTQAC
ncbi:MAG: ClbS/DfsB family four-helix bundle protein, partial [Paracoccaceae bacterium]|nr:ClbS/DfsB family four-helix bundle protein [Paracoccaceae bacterium]